MLNKLFSKKKYQPKARWGHSSVAVGNKMISWGGMQSTLPEVHTSEQKTRLTSLIEVFDLETGRWSQESTVGPPPLGVRGHASAVIEADVFYFGGFCGHDWCRHNSLHCLDTINHVWRLVEPSNPSRAPMRKSRCGMVSFSENGQNFLCVFGGTGLLSSANQEKATYIPWKKNPDWGWTNEVHIFNFATGEWMTPTVTGDVPPACAGFTLTEVSADSAVLCGGFQPQNGGCVIDAYLMKLSTQNIHWTKIDLNRNGEQLEIPTARQDHTSFCLSGPLYGHHKTVTMIIGGRDPDGSTLNDCWLLSVDDKQWMQVFFLDVMAYRHFHSSTVFHLSPDYTLAVVFGGVRGWLWRKPEHHQPAVSATAILEAAGTPTEGWQIRVIMGETESTPSNEYYQQIARHLKGEEKDNENHEERQDNQIEEDGHQHLPEVGNQHLPGEDRNLHLPGEDRNQHLLEDGNLHLPGEDMEDIGVARSTRFSSDVVRTTTEVGHSRKSSTDPLDFSMEVGPRTQEDQLDTSHSMELPVKHKQQVTKSSASSPPRGILMSSSYQLQHTSQTISSLKEKLAANSLANNQNIIQCLERELAVALGRTEEIEGMLHNAVMNGENRAVLAEERTRAMEGQVLKAQEQVKSYQHQLEQVEDRMCLAYAEEISQLQNEALSAEERVIEAETLLMEARLQIKEQEARMKEADRQAKRMEEKIKEVEHELLKREDELKLANEIIAKEMASFLIPKEDFAVIVDSCSDMIQTDEVSFQHSTGFYCGSKVSRIIFRKLFTDNEKDHLVILDCIKSLASLHHPRLEMFLGAILDEEEEEEEEGSPLQGHVLHESIEERVHCGRLNTISIISEHFSSNLHQKLESGIKFEDREMLYIVQDVTSALHYLEQRKLRPFINTKLDASYVLLENDRAKLSIVKPLLQKDFGKNHHKQINSKLVNGVLNQPRSEIQDLGLLIITMATSSQPGSDTKESGINDEIRKTLKHSKLCNVVEKCLEHYSVISLREILTDLQVLNHI